MPSTPSSTRTLVPPEKNEADVNLLRSSSPAEDYLLPLETAAGPARERASRDSSGKRVSGSLPVGSDATVVPLRGRIESVEGLVSIDRSVVAALLSTTPRA